MHDQTDDIEVIHLVLKGNQGAYATLVTRYQSYVFTLVLRYVNNREVAEELAQDVFVKAYKFLADFKGACKFSTWLYTIVNSTCLSHLRKKKEEIVYMEQEKMVSFSDSFHPGEAPVKKLEDKTQKQLIEHALKFLPEADGRMIGLFYQGEQTVEEIGNIMGLTTSNVKVRLFRARQKLKEILETKFSREIC